MFRVNQNISALKPSATLAINQRVMEMRKANKEVIHFGFGQSPFPIHSSITDSLKKHVSKNDYVETTGLVPLRHAIVDFLEKYQGLHIKPDLVFIGPGSKELLYQTILIFEGTFLIPKGSWVSYGPQIKSKGSNYTVLNTKLENNFRLQAKTLETYLNNNKDDNQKTIILNTPNNPTGAFYSVDELKEIAEVCRKNNVLVLSDEIYSQINFELDHTPNISAYYPEGTIVFGGLSKVFSAGGYRLGFMALPEELRYLHPIIRSLFSETFSAVASPIQHAAIEAYSPGQQLLDYIRTCSKILGSIASFVHSKLSVAGIQCTKPQGAFYMVIGFEPFKKEIQKLGIKTSPQLAEYILENYQVALLPGSDFYFNDDELYFRLAYVDFDGAAVLKAYEREKKIDDHFIEVHCPHIYKGTMKLVELVKNLA